MNLSKRQEVDLIAAESVIEKGLATFVEVGDALTKIRDGKLYLLKHDTFEDYCAERWGMSRHYAHRLMSASETVGDLLPMGNKDADSAPEMPVPATERVAREVAKAPRAKRKEVWDKAVETAPKGADGTPKVTAAHARKAVAAVVTPEPPAPPPKEPPPEPVDSEGVSVPPSLRAAFENAARFDELLSALKAFKGMLTAVGGDGKDRKPVAGGDELAAHMNAAANAYKELYTHVKQTKPHAVCPYCGGKGCKSSEKCYGLGWMSELSYARVPADLRLPPSRKGRAA